VAAAEGELAAANLASGESVEETFEREWVRGLIESACVGLQAELESSGRGLHFRVFRDYDLEPAAEVSYDSLARATGLTVGEVTHHLAYARHRFRRILLDRLRELTLTEEEFREEAQNLLAEARQDGDDR
jgi:hypothetical protein